MSDENKNVSKEYKDKEGKVVLKLVINKTANATDTLKTYYVYDVHNQLRYVIPPLASKYLESNTAVLNFNPSHTILKDINFYYRYDDRKRLVEKRLPGADPVLMVYDTRDRMVLSQDGNMRKNKQWLFTKYDAFNRPILTGMANFGTSKQTDLQANTTLTTPASESRSVCAIGYSNTLFSTNVVSYLTATFYDDYTYFGVIPYDTKSNLSGKTPIATEKGGTIKGKVTGSKVMILDEAPTPTYTLTTTYYDDRYRPIEVLRSNILPSCANAGETVSSRYDFAGKVMESKQCQNVEGLIDSIHHRMAYDHAGRLLKTEMNINGSAYKTQSTLSYNNLGQLQTKKLGTVDTTSYTYTVRGWLKTMNSLIPSPKANFGMTLFYNDSMINLKNTKQWNGNISGIKWATSTLDETFGYAYSYDGVNRLTSATFGRSTSNNNWPTTKSYCEPTITYDSNGNILSYLRYGSDGSVLMDSMKYTYCNNGYSNKLKKITDHYKGGMPITDDKVTTAYTYDVNGNLYSDNGKHINSISYNHLNLPKNIKFAVDTILTYIYDATGTKLSKLADPGAGSTKTLQYYAGNMIYDKNKKLLFILTDEGRAVKYGSSFTYEYNVKDHLGNVRMVLKDTTATPVLAQENHYYPFGSVMQGLGTNAVAALKDKTSPKSEYLYNGKEMQEDFGLGWLDFDHRFYDPLRPTFGTIDRFSEKFPWQSPYCYAGNNPILNIDVNGDSVRLTNAYQKNAQIMKVHNEWLKTDAGKKFMKMFGEGGRFENVAVVFDAVDPNKLGALGSNGQEYINLVNSEGKAIDINPGPISQDVINTLLGQKNGMYIRSKIDIGIGDFSTDFLKAILVETHLHEEQHLLMDINSILQTGNLSTPSEQHVLMRDINKGYFMSRYNSYWQVRSLWLPTYMQKRKDYNNDVIKFVRDQVNDF